ncbi:hypothetical protein RAH32_18625 [Paracoccus sp. WLY502]|uniref:hypothetical protein n=1 Tax=Paracoccus yibinensis TaxID=3068891 RepID=UPI0027968664|nr:hypothetical protein [Paracoccus sp. WLY502]MDQ1902440.1 hypothetical protein [Paracoccus sp. WLY502]
MFDFNLVAIGIEEALVRQHHRSQILKIENDFHRFKTSSRRALAALRNCNTLICNSQEARAAASRLEDSSPMSRVGMAERNDISDLLAFISREATWRERLKDVVAEHLLPALEAFEMDLKDLAELFGRSVVGC